MKDILGLDKKRFDPFGEVIRVEQVHTRTIHGWMASFLSKGSAQSIRLLVMLILARLLTPEDFGIVAIAISAIGVAHIFKDMGLSAATIRARTLSHPQVTSLFWMNAGFGALMTLVCWLLAPQFAEWFDDSRFVAVIRVLAFDFLIGALGIQHSSLLRRHMRFTELAWIRVSATLIGSGAAVLLAFLGFGYWALVASTLLITLVSTLLYWLYCPFLPSGFGWDTEVRGLVSFGGHMMVFAIMGFFAQAVPNLVIGGVYGAEDAGFYSRAYVLFTLCLAYALEPLGLVAPAAMARMAEAQDAYRRYYLGLVTILAVITVPVSFLFIGLAEEVTLILLGGQWDETAGILQLIGIGVLPYVICYTSGWLYLSKGNARRMMLWGLFGYGFLILNIWLNRHGGLRWIGGVYAVSLWIMVWPCMAMAVYQTGVRSSEIFRVCVRPLCAGFLTLLCIIAMRELVLYWPLAWRTFACGLFGITVYAALMLSGQGMRKEIQAAITLVKKTRRNANLEGDQFESQDISN